MNTNMKELKKFKLTPDILNIAQNCKGVTVPKTREELLSLALGGNGANSFEVNYEIKGKGICTEAVVVRCKNGVAVNFPEDYMRRRDPECLVVADDLPTDKIRFKDKYKQDFSSLRADMFKWLTEQELIVMPFLIGGTTCGHQAVLVAPKNTAFFACGLADLQFFVNIDDYKEFAPQAVIFIAPPYRHTFFGGKQMVIHNRLPEMYEMFANNLYPGPSAKKGTYGFLLDVGEREKWITAHASAVKVVTPYENEIVIMHEGASGGGKSEMGESIHREPNGQILLGRNTVTKEKFFLNLQETCELCPVADDMALCHPSMQNDSRKLVIGDAENGWFLRLDHIKGYGTEPFNEKLCTQPSEPLVFINIQAVPDSTCLIWEHTLDSDGTPCPNPRVIMPRKMVAGIVDQPVEVDIRSFGVRAPACTKENPTYGIMGMMHILPPALAWLWRLVAPRGHNNPSITSSEGMTSEGVGSFWPFATGKMYNYANLLLEQIRHNPSTRCILIPNQHIGCYEVGFKPQWIIREYIARRGSAKFKQEHLVPARSSLLGYCLDSLKVDGQYIRKAFLQPETQKEMGVEAYDKGAAILGDFFKKELKKFMVPELDPMGKKIIDICMKDGTLEDYLNVLPMKY